MEMLKNIRDTEKRMQRLYEKIMRHRSAAEFTVPLPRDGGKGTGSNDPLGNRIVIIDELQQEYDGLIAEYHTAVDKAEELLQPLSEADREILRLRYYDALPWREVAQRAGYSESHCKRINGRFKKMIPNDTFRCAIM